jgi:hypothetical protein
MQVGEQQLAFAEQRDFLRLGFLYFYDQFSSLENFCGVDHYTGTGKLVVGITDADTVTKPALHQYLMAVLYQFMHAGRYHAGAEFLVFDFTGYADQQR